MESCIRRLSSILTSLNFAGNRLRIVCRNTVNRPLLLFFPQKSLQGQVTMRVTSMGNTLMHEMKSSERPDDPISMFHLDGDRLLMTHYCNAGNQPRMVGTVSTDGKTIAFDFLNATNLLSSQEGHMQHVVFTLIDSDHHTELWQFATADGKKMGGLLDLHRTK